MMKSMKGALALSLTAMMMSAAGPAQADGGTEALIKYRQGVMKAMSGHIGAVAQIVKDGVPYRGDLPSHAASLQTMAQLTARHFPKGSGEGKTNAKKEIWQNLDDFNKLATLNGKAATLFAAAVKSANKAEITKTFGAFLKSCKDCHKDYRAKKN